MLPADRVGLRLMARACFDPTRAPAVWERFEVFNKKQGSVPELLSTHPADEKRMKKMREWLPEVGFSPYSRPCTIIHDLPLTGGG